MFYAILVQEGEGCDYTISCGTKAIKLKGSTKDECAQELVDLIKDEYSHDERRLESAKLVELRETIDLGGLYGALEAEEARRNAEQQRKKDEAAYEALARKLGKL